MFVFFFLLYHFFAVPPEITAVINVVHTKLMINAQLECIVSNFFKWINQRLNSCLFLRNFLYKQVTSQPQANVHWFHHGLPVTPNSRISRQDHAILANQTINDYHSNTKHLLIIRNIKENDFGVYECRAENSMGMNSASIELTGRPMVPVFKKSPMAADHMAHYLIWQTESLSPIFEHKLKFRKIPSGNITPNMRKFASAWHEIIVPAEVSEGKRRKKFSVSIQLN